MSGRSILDDEVVSSWLASLDVAQTTKSSYEAGFRRFLAWCEACGLDFDGLEQDDVVAFKADLERTGRLSPATVSLALSAVRSFYRWSASRGLEDIARNVRGARVSRDFKKNALTLDQARALLDSLSGDDEGALRDRALITLMLTTGLRDIEVSRALVEDLSTKAGNTVLYVHGKGRREKDQFVVVPRLAEDPLRAYLAVRGPLRPRSPLFASCANRNRGESLTVQSISRIVKGSLRRIGIDDPRVTAHSLRHTAITFALLGGASEREAQAMARHADLATTLVYSHDIARLASAAESKAADYLAASPSQETRARLLERIMVSERERIEGKSVDAFDVTQSLKEKHRLS